MLAPLYYSHQTIIWALDKKAIANTFFVMSSKKVFHTQIYSVAVYGLTSTSLLLLCYWRNSSPFHSYISAVCNHIRAHANVHECVNAALIYSVYKRKEIEEEVRCVLFNAWLSMAMGQALTYQRSIDAFMYIYMISESNIQQKQLYNNKTSTEQKKKRIQVGELTECLQ